MTNAFEAAFAPLKPLLVEQFENFVTRQIERYTQEWDVTERRVREANGTFRFVRGFMQMDSDRMSARPVGVKTEWLRKRAEENAAAQIAEFAAKLTKKLGELGEFEAKFARGGDFTVTGTRNGHKVRVEQQTVFKVSSHGKPFNQFPARIYVDGNFTPAKDYETAVA